MALVGNGVRLGLSNPMRQLGAPLAHVVHRAGWGTPGAARNLWAGEATVVGGASIADRSAIPDGHRHPSAWVMAPKNGGMAARFELVGVGGVNASIAGGLNAEAAIGGAGDLSAQLGALAGLIASVSGVGGLTGLASGLVEIAAALVGSGSMSGDMGLLIGAVAALAGVGALSGDMTAAASVSATLSGDGALTALLTATSDIVASLTGGGTMSGTPSALGQMSASITVAAAEDPLSPSALAAAVWNALAASFNGAGTMGEVLNSAGGGSSPSQVAAAVWAALRATGQDAGSMGEALVELFDLMGLDPAKPLVVTPTSRDAGAGLSQTITTAGTTTTVTRDP